MSDSDLAQYVKRRIKFDSVDVHPVEKALVVFYRIEAVLLSQDGEAMAGEKRESQKMIKVQSLNSTTDVNGLAKEVIHQCKLIPSSRVNEVQQLLSYLQQRPDSKTASTEKHRPLTSSSHSDVADILSQTDEQASMTKLDTYVELLYEEVEGKIRGTSLILQLAKQNDNLQDLSKNESLIGALYRVLREDGRKHYALAINITFTFFYFATFSTFHPVLTRFKVGSLLMEIVRWELQRFDQWETELKSGHFEQDGLHRKIQTALLQQTLLIRTSFYVLLHLSEDPTVEDKMRKKGIVSLLIRTLQRKHLHSSVNELNYLVLTFLQKLSIFGENKDEMVQQGVIEKAAVLVDSPHRLVQDSAARVLYNLSFDPALRLRIGRLGLLPSLIRMMLADSQGGSIAWALVYQISLDDRGRILISRSECFSFVLEYLLRCKETPLPSIPLALAVNLVHVAKLAAELSQSKYFALFLDSAVTHHDAVLIKLLRNATGHALSSHHNSNQLSAILVLHHNRRTTNLFFSLDFLTTIGIWLEAVAKTNLLSSPEFPMMSDKIYPLNNIYLDNDYLISKIIKLNCVSSLNTYIEHLGLEAMNFKSLYVLLKSLRQRPTIATYIVYVFFLLHSLYIVHEILQINLMNTLTYFVSGRSGSPRESTKKRSKCIILSLTLRTAIISVWSS
nr:EOG090X049M [Eurycercus lamellatus]